MWRKLWPRLGTFSVLVCSGFLLLASAQISQGNDLRPSRNTDIVGLVDDAAQRNKELQSRAGELRGEITNLSDDIPEIDKRELSTREQEAGLSAVRGEAVRVALDDAPLDVAPVGIDPDWLVVHQEDIQMVANQLWAAGAEAMTLQGQRITSVTGIKCVGNTVLVHGVPYAPPYELVAIGDPAELQAGLEESEEIAVYKEYVESFSLGYEQEVVGTVTLPEYRGTIDLSYARPAE